MSHFSVLVVTDNKPSESDLEKILAPWHEFECTGDDNEYVVEVDMTDEIKKDWENETFNRLVDADGNIHDSYSDEFHRDPTPEELEEIGDFPGTGCTASGLSYTSQDWGDGKGYRVKVRYTPEGMEKKDLPATEVYTLAEYAEYWHGFEIVKHGEEIDLTDTHKYGYTLVDKDGNMTKAVRRTNPNSKWDWWVVGGRWTGALIPNYDPSEDPDNQETCWLCHGTGMRNDEVGRNARLADPTYTCNGCNGTGTSKKWPTQWKRVEGDQMQRKDLNLVALQQEAASKAAKTYDEAAEVIAGRTVPDWDKFRESFGDDITAAREAYWELPVNKDWKNITSDLRWSSIQDFACTREEYIAKRVAQAVPVYAVVKDGEWSSKGDMGWFGVSLNEDDEWYVQFNKMLEEMDENKWLTMVDCHI